LTARIVNQKRNFAVIQSGAPTAVFEQTHRVYSRACEPGKRQARLQVI
jgi:hypothetical protein